MLAIAGAIFIAVAVYIGIPNQVDASSGLASLLAGVALITWDFLNRFKRLIRYMPLIIGLAMLGILGIYGRDVWGLAGGIAIMTVWFWKTR